MGEEVYGEQWSKDDQFFKQKLPRVDLSSIDKYVQNVLSHVSDQTSIPLPELFETHYSVIARMKVSSKADVKQIKISVNSTQLKLKGIYDREEKLIKLPCCVEAAYCKALLKNGILEVKMPKVKHNSSYYEVPIHHLRME